MGKAPATPNEQMSGSSLILAGGQKSEEKLLVHRSRLLWIHDEVGGDHVHAREDKAD